MEMHTTPEPAPEPSWPLLTAEEVRRLQFIAYLHRTGRIGAPAPVSAEVDTLCAALLREPAPRVAPDRYRPASYGGLPLMWRAWAEEQEKRKRQRA